MPDMRRRSKNKNACKIYISCSESSDDGKMQVEMTCEGDQVLAAYLLENAQTFLDTDEPDSHKLTSMGD